VENPRWTSEDGSSKFFVLSFFALRQPSPEETESE
jgi:hypothetical protein